MTTFNTNTTATKIAAPVAGFRAFIAKIFGLKLAKERTDLAQFESRDISLLNGTGMSQARAERAAMGHRPRY